MIKIKKVNISKNMDFDSIQGTKEWYLARNQSYDTYGALEYIKNGEDYYGDEIFLIHYPDGKTYKPFEKEKNTCITNPIINNEIFYFLKMDLIKKISYIYEYNPIKEDLNLMNEINIGKENECYNLSLKGMPLTVFQDGEECFQILWPENKKINIESNEIFLFREHDNLYFERWYDDISQKEDTIIRDIKTGEVINNIKGKLIIMPNNDIWQI